MRIKRIDSPANSIYKELSSLVSAKGIRKHKKVLISGEKIISEVAQRMSDDSFFIFNSESHPLFHDFTDRQVLVLQKDLFEDLDVVGTGAPLLCVPLPAFHNWSPELAVTEHELLLAVGDPSNLGAIVRSARAFGLRKIVLLKECADPFLPKVTKAASGCNFLVEFQNGPSIQDLSATPSLFALDMNGTSIQTIDGSTPARWLVGQEGLGLPRTLDCGRVSIPMSAGVESLNAAVSASILLYHIFSSNTEP